MHQAGGGGTGGGIGVRDSRWPRFVIKCISDKNKTDSLDLWALLFFPHFQWETCNCISSSSFLNEQLGHGELGIFSISILLLLVIIAHSAHTHQMIIKVRIERIKGE